MEQAFINDDAQTFDELEAFPGASWTVLAEPVPQGPHVAKTDVELMTVRLGPMGEFESNHS